MEALKKYDFIANFVTTRSVEVRFEQGKVKSVENEIEESVVVRVHDGRKFGIISCSPTRFNDAIKNVKKVLKHNFFGKYEIPSPRKTTVKTYNRKLLRSVDELIDLHPESKYEIPAGHISVGQTTFRVVNSRGEETSYKETFFAFSFDMTNGEDTTFVHYSGNKFVEPQKLVDEAEFWLQKLPKKKYDGEQVILDYDATAELIDVFMSNFNAYNMYAGISRFKLNDYVANFDIIDDPTIPLGSESYPVDCEGIKAKRKYIIRDGKFACALTNIFTATKMKLQLSGNASGLGLAAIEPSNLIIEGKEEGEKNGLMVNFVLGVHTINIASGDASLGIGNGIIVKDGEAIARVKGMVNINLYEAFKQAKFIDKQKDVDGIITRRMQIPAIVVS